MFVPLTKTSITRNLLFMIAAFVFFSCQKEMSMENGGIVPMPDLVTKVRSSVSGFVTDENDAAVSGATVQFGAAIVSTDKYGYFEARNVQVVKNSAAVTVTRTGYFKGIKTYMAQDGKSAFFRIKLIPKITVGNISATPGGTVSLANGLSIKLPAGAVVNAATNVAYTGTVNVAAHWINPEAPDINAIMPGDLRAIDANGSMKLLQTFGMAAVELTGAAGELLQIAPGKKATLTMAIPSSLNAAAPVTIPLWHFDEAVGLWKEEGSAVRTGNSYVGDVSHFSFWNCDIPANFVQFNCTLRDQTGNPLSYIPVRMTVVGTSNSVIGYTDSSGVASGAVPINSNLLMEVLPNWGCTVPVYSQAFTTTTVNVSLGTITVSMANNVATLSGTVTNCANTPVTDGYLIVHQGTWYTRYNLNNAGAFNFTRVFCSLPQSLTLVGEDVTNQQQSAAISYTVNGGANNVGNIQACGFTTQQFINYSVNGTNISLNVPVDTIMTYGTNTSVVISGGQPLGNNSISMSFRSQGIGLNSSQELTFLGTQPQMTNPTIQNPIFVQITEYGPVGGFISGNFSGNIVEFLPPNTVYNVTCNFRVRRTY